MIKIISCFILAVLIGVILWVTLTNYFTTKEIVHEFERCNVIVFGKKGNGKDLLFQKVINKRKDLYYSNISYGGEYKHCKVKDLELTPNTCDSFINGEITTIKKNSKFEGHDFYFSDLGVILPSQYDNKLYKNYPSFPIEYALSRHLYNNNIHFNTQNLGRGWKALREQADFYIKCRGVVKLPFILFVKVTMYDKYESAEKSLEPYRIPLIGNKFQQAEARQYKATNGYIKKGFVLISKKHIYYDTRAYHKIIFGKKSTFPHSLIKSRKRKSLKR